MPKPENPINEERVGALKQLSRLPGVESFSNKTAFDLATKLTASSIPFVLYGPPGTGKSRLASQLKEHLRRHGGLGLVEQIQFHKEFSYEDFIEGYVPAEGGRYVIRSGVFKAFCEKAAKFHNKLHLFVIDEINRGDISSIFGEVLYLIEDRRERTAKTAHSHQDFSIPENVVLIGTMNTADRNIAIIDFALRRRFLFIPVFPDYQELEAWILSKGFSFKEFTVKEYCSAARKLNQRILSSPLLGKGMQLGQSFFVPRQSNKTITLEDVVDNFNLNLLPQIEAYIGIGYEEELSKILNPAVSHVLRSGGMMSKELIVGLIKSLCQSES